MFNGLVKDSVALYAGTKMIKKSKKKQTVEPTGIFTDAFKAKAQARLEAYIAKKELEIQLRKTQVTK